MRASYLQYVSDDGTLRTCNKTIIHKADKSYLLRQNTQAGILTSVPGLKQDLAFEAMTHFVGPSKSRNQGSKTFNGTEEKDARVRRERGGRKFCRSTAQVFWL